MTAFVLVPGMCHGGWWYEPLAERLAAAGHEGVPVTPEGLGPEGLQGVVNLTTHVDQVARIAEALEPPVVLVGHSWGGMVINGVADRMPGHVAGLVHLDSFVPQDGESSWALTNDEERAWFVEASAADGLTVPPLPFFDDRAMPHPLASVMQALPLTGAWTEVPVKHYAVARQWPFPSPMIPTSDRLRDDPAWTHHDWDTRHNVMHDGPGRVLELLLAVAAEIGA